MTARPTPPVTPPPTVSVLLHARGDAAAVAETLRSLAAQTMADWEAVAAVGDDPSGGLVRGWPDPRVRVVHAGGDHGPGGVARARNLAAAAARGRYLAGMEAGDTCHPDRFARQVARLDREPKLAALGAAATYVEDGRDRASDQPSATSPALVEWLLRIDGPLLWSAAMLRADAARLLDPFLRPECGDAAELDLFHRLARLGRIARLDQPLVRHRPGPAPDDVGAAAAVLEDAHRARFGEDAPRVARLFAEHLWLRRAVPDRVALRALGDALGAAQARFLSERPLDPADQRLIRAETTRRWGRVGRTGLLAGTIGPADVVAVRPEHLGLGYASVPRLAWAGTVGGARRLLHTLAA